MWHARRPCLALPPLHPVFICLAYWKNWERRPGSCPQEAPSWWGDQTQPRSAREEPWLRWRSGWRVALAWPARQRSSEKGGQQGLRQLGRFL